MIRIVGPIESAMYKKYPATRYIHEPREHFVAGPQAIIDATAAHRKKAAEFIRSETCSKLAAFVEEMRRNYELAQKALTTACEEHCAAERAVIEAYWKARREGREAKTPEVEVPNRRYHDRNWVDEEFGAEETYAAGDPSHPVCLKCGRALVRGPVGGGHFDWLACKECA